MRAIPAVRAGHAHGARVLSPPTRAGVLEDARDCLGLGNFANHTKLAPTVGTRQNRDMGMTDGAAREHPLVGPTEDEDRIHYTRGPGRMATVNRSKDHVAECLNEESSAVDVNYNKWFASEEYRKELCQRLKIPHSDTGLEDVGAFGGGSSFEGMSSHGQASRMDVFNRWKAIEGEPGLRRLFMDEIRELNYRYFEITYPFTSP